MRKFDELLCQKEVFENDFLQKSEILKEVFTNELQLNQLDFFCLMM
jgi:hypothetical protein